MDVIVNLEWEEEPGEEKIIRPYHAVLKLFQNGKEYKEVSIPDLCDTYSWSHSWMELPDGDYTVAEVSGEEKYYEKAVIDRISETGTGDTRSKIFTLKKYLKNGNVSVALRVTGTAADKDRAWKFTINGLGHNARQYTRFKNRRRESGTFFDGDSFTLENGERIAFDIPLISHCEIKWEEDSQGYDTTYVVTGDCIYKAYEENQVYIHEYHVNPKHNRVAVEIIKHRDEDPDVEPKSNWKKFLLPLGIFCFGQLLSAAIRKKERSF